MSKSCREIVGVRQARGVVVITDGLYAFSTACDTMGRRVRGMIPVAAAVELCQRHLNWILIGEARGIKVAGCDLGNSPGKIEAYLPIDSILDVAKAPMWTDPLA